MQSYRRHLPKSSFCVQLKIGNHEFKGIGCTRQQARHNAASKALVVLKCVPLQRKTESTSNSEDPGGGSNGKGLVCEEKTGRKFPLPTLSFHNILPLPVAASSRKMMGVVFPMMFM